MEATLERSAPALQRNIPGTSLAICSRNRLQMLTDTVRSILDGNELPAELIIIDQSDLPAPHLSDLAIGHLCEIRYHHIQPRGVSQARNTAIRMARENILIFTDDDMLAPANWFGCLVRGLIKAGKNSVVTGQVAICKDDSFRGTPTSITTLDKPTVYIGRIEKDILFTNNMAAYRSIFNAVGGFDERIGPGTAFPAAEDNDLAFRLLEAGYKIFYDPEALIYHRAWRSDREYLKNQENYGYGQGAFYAKYFNLKDRFMLKRFFKDFFNYSIRAPFHFFRNPRQAHVNAVFSLALLTGAVRWILTHKSNRQ
jgi:glycosyltransferase involved in cell wall biosynthesis